jgi:hypothetical protein
MGTFAEVTLNMPPPQMEMEFVCNFFVTKFFGIRSLSTYIILNRLRIELYVTHFCCPFLTQLTTQKAQKHPPRIIWLLQQMTCTGEFTTIHYASLLHTPKSVSQRVYAESYTKSMLCGVYSMVRNFIPRTLYSNNPCSKCYSLT